MDISRKLGILVFFGVPVIIGGGIMYALFDSKTVMFIYEIVLLLVAGAVIARLVPGEYFALGCNRPREETLKDPPITIPFSGFS